MSEQKECWECRQAERHIESKTPLTRMFVSIIVFFLLLWWCFAALLRQESNLVPILAVVSVSIVVVCLFGWVYVQFNVIGQYCEAYLENGEVHVHLLLSQKVHAYRTDENARGEHPRIVFRVGGYWKRGFVIRDRMTSDENSYYMVRSWSGSDLRIFSASDGRDFVSRDFGFIGVFINADTTGYAYTRAYLSNVLHLLEKTGSVFSWVLAMRKRHDLLAANLIGLLREIERNRSMGRSKHVQWIRESLEEQLGCIPEELLKAGWSDDPEELDRIMARRNRRLIRQLEGHSWQESA